MEYHIRQYDLQQGALEIEYIEEYFGCLLYTSDAADE